MQPNTFFLHSCYKNISRLSLKKHSTESEATSLLVKKQVWLQATVSAKRLGKTHTPRRLVEAHAPPLSQGCFAISLLLHAAVSPSSPSVQPTELPDHPVSRPMDLPHQHSPHVMLVPLSKSLKTTPMWFFDPCPSSTPPKQGRQPPHRPCQNVQTVYIKLMS